MADPLIIKICGIKTEKHPRRGDRRRRRHGRLHAFPALAAPSRLDPIGELISLARGRVETCVVLVNPDNTLRRAGRGARPRLDPAPRARNAASRRGDPRRGRHRDPQGLPDRRRPRTSRRVAAFADVADRILLDAKPPKGADRPGGLGDTFDWALLKALDPALPFMLSGGLTPDTVAAAIRSVRPMGVDVSSGVETAPGVKDAKLIAAFINNARAGRGELVDECHREDSGPGPIPCATAPTRRAASASIGGRFVAETLMPLILDLEAAYRAAQDDPGIRGRARRTSRPTMSAGPRRSITPSG